MFVRINEFNEVDEMLLTNASYFELNGKKIINTSSLSDIEYTKKEIRINGKNLCKFNLYSIIDRVVFVNSKLLELKKNNNNYYTLQKKLEE